MMGRLNHDQEQLLYSFHLDEAVPHDHPVRKIAAVLDLSWVHSDLAPFYPKLGRPSIDPELMIRMLIIGYVFAIRSERAICRDVQVNLAYRWFCGLSIEDKIPDHSAFSRARHERFRDSDMFRRVVERVVEACIAAGLVGGEEFAVDASLIAADANKQRSIPGSEWNKARDPHSASRAMREYLATLDEAGRKMSLPPRKPRRTYAASRGWSLDRPQRPMHVLRSRCHGSVPFDPASPLRKERMVRTVPRGRASSLAATIADLCNKICQKRTWR